MKLIKEGHWNNPWSKQFVCTEKQCEATLLVEESDLSPVDYSNQNDFCFTCMVCGKVVKIPAREIPARLQKTLNAKRKYYDSDWR